MSRMKNMKILFSMIIAFFAMFIFGCESHTAVEDIYFELEGEQSQIVLLVDQTFDLGDIVQVEPSYASNKLFSVSSLNPAVVKVDGRKIVAKTEGEATIIIKAEDNANKQDVMTVVVKKEKIYLGKPVLHFDEQTQTISFGSVAYSSGYTVRINGEEHKLGNVTSFNVSDYISNSYNSLISVEVKSDSPRYSHAIESLGYSDPFRFYQASQIENIEVVGGVLQFSKVNNFACDVFLDDKLFAGNTNSNIVSLKNLDEKHAGKKVVAGVVSKVSDEIKSQFGSDIAYFDSKLSTIEFSVLEALNPTMTMTDVSWQTQSGIEKYIIYINDVVKAEVSTNHFNLSTLEDFSSFGDALYSVKVEAIISAGAKNIAKTNRLNEIQFSRLNEPEFIVSNSSVEWTKDDKISAYSLKLDDGHTSITTSTKSNKFSFADYESGTYTLHVSSVSVGKYDGVFYISSKPNNISIFKQEIPDIKIENYHLIIEGETDGYYSVKIGDEEAKVYPLDENSPAKSVDVDLSEINFSSGTHEIVVYKTGDESTTIDGNVTSKVFTQLAPVTISVEGGKLKANRNPIDDEKFIIKTTGEKEFDLEFESVVNYSFNSTNPDENETYLPAGDYSSVVQVVGNGSSTFSYRQNGEIITSEPIDFKVLGASSLSLESQTSKKLIISQVENASKYKIFDAQTDVKKYEGASLSWDCEVSSGVRKSYYVQAIGDGTTTLDSVKSEKIVIEKLAAPTISFDNETNQIKGLVKGDSKGYDAIESYSLTFNGNIILSGDKCEDFCWESVYNYLDLDSSKNQATINVVADVTGESGGDLVYYLHPNSASLTISKINSEGTTVSITNENKLKISAPGGLEGYTVEVKINDESFETSNSHIIELLDGDNNFKIDDLTAGEPFNVKIKYQPKDTNEAESEWVDCGMVKIDKITSNYTVSYDTNNKELCVDPNGNTDAERYYIELKIILNRGTATEKVLHFKRASDTENQYKLYYESDDGSESYELTYRESGSTDQYKVKILNDDFSRIIEELTKNFDVQFKFFKNLIGTSDLDGDWGNCQLVNVSQTPEQTRNGNILSISKVTESKNIKFVVNGKYSSLVKLDDMISLGVVTESNASYDMDMVKLMKNVEGIDEDIKNSEFMVETIIVENGKVQAKSLPIYLKQQSSVSIKTQKGNYENNNSLIVYFDILKPEYAVEYEVILTDSDGNQINTKTTYTNEDADGYDQIVLIIDEFDTPPGEISIAVTVKTSGTYTLNGKLINVFDSATAVKSSIGVLAAPVNIKVENGTLKFDSVENAAGYEVYSVGTGTSLTKLNSSLLTSPSFDLGKINYGTTYSLVVKAIGNETYSNSDYSDVVKVQKINSPELKTENGCLVVTTFNEVSSWLGDGAEIVVIVKNGGQSYSFDLSNLGEDATINSKHLTIVKNVLKYGANSLLKEDLQVKIGVSYEKNGVMYVDSDESLISVYGLHAPTEIKKVLLNGTAEYIEWTPSDINKFGENEITEIKYEFNFVYAGKTYSSTDEKLKYYDGTNYVSYGNNLTSSRIKFPYGYDVDNDGTFIAEDGDIIFEAGDYKVQVKVIPTANVGTKNLCVSNYSSEDEFKILAAPVLRMENGVLVWDGDVNAEKYELNFNSYLGPNNSDTIIMDSTSYDFGSLSFEGFMNVTIKTIAKEGSQALNSQPSDSILMYRIESTSVSISIDDGKLAVTLPKYHKFLILDCSDTTNENEPIHKEIENTSFEDDIDEWKDILKDGISVEESFQIMEEIKQTKTIYLADIGFRSAVKYKFKIQLKGNTSSVVMVGNSKVVQDSDLSLNSTRLKPAENTVSKGVITLSANSEYLSSGTLIGFNYNFNGSTPSSDFWGKTIIYKTKITINGAEHVIYSVDYNSIIKERLSSGTDYIENKTNGMFGYIKYPYGDNEFIYFNIYENNQIDLRNNDYISYYKVIDKFDQDPLTIGFSSQTTLSTIDLTSGGIIYVETFILGGDKSDNGEGWITSYAQKLNYFVKYGSNTLNSYKGFINFQNLIPKDGEGNVVDYPVYQIKVVDSFESEKYLYGYYDGHESEAQEIAKQIDNNWESAEFVKIESGDLYGLKFALENYFPYGYYTISIRTLAGFGAEGQTDGNYLLHAREDELSEGYGYWIYTPTEFTNVDGKLTFDRSYRKIGSQTYYASEYEILLYVNDESTPKTITISDSDLQLSGNKATYILPEKYSSGDYEIKIRAINSKSNDKVINSSFYIEDGQSEDYLFEFERAESLASFEVANGRLEWSGSNKIEVTITYGTGTTYVLNFTVEGTQISEGKYFYEFRDDNSYPLVSSGTYTSIDSGVTYKISARAVVSRFINSTTSAEVQTERLDTVTEIGASDGKLVWSKIEGATSYQVIVYGNQNYEFETEENMLDLANEIESGDVKVSIKAKANRLINSKVAQQGGLIKLEKVKSIEIGETEISWEEVENAQGYLVIIENQGTDKYNGIVTTTSIDAPSGITEKFTISITAVGVGKSNILTGETLTVESSSDAPKEVDEIEYDEVLVRYTWYAPEGFLSGDRFVISYNHNMLANVEPISIGYQENGYYDHEKDLYYYPLTVVGEYSEFSIIVKRSGTLNSSEATAESKTFDLFASGAGTESSPYEIEKADQLMNIAFNPAANYKITDSITLVVDESQLSSKISENCLALICETFTGVIDGQGGTIYFGNVNLQTAESFALFKNLRNATIKNMNFGDSAGKGSINLTKSFANNCQNVVKLSIIATEAENSKFEGIKVYGFNVSLKGSGSIENKAYVGAIVSIADNSTFTGCQVNVKVSSVDVTNNSYIYVGGIVAKSLGEGTITSCKSKIDVQNTQIQYLGGIVAKTETTNISSCSVSGIIKHQALGFDVTWGGIVGNAQGSCIKECESTIEFNVTLSTGDVNNKNIGAIVGSASSSGVNSEINTCGSQYVNVGKTVISDKSVNVGLYGTVTNTTTITACYQIEQN